MDRMLLRGVNRSLSIDSFAGVFSGKFKGDRIDYRGPPKIDILGFVRESFRGAEFGLSKSADLPREFFLSDAIGALVVAIEAFLKEGSGSIFSVSISGFSFKFIGHIQDSIMVD